MKMIICHAHTGKWAANFVLCNSQNDYLKIVLQNLAKNLKYFCQKFLSTRQHAQKLKINDKLIKDHASWNMGYIKLNSSDL